LQAKVRELPCGKTLHDLNALQPSSLRAYLATDSGFNDFVTHGATACAAVGAYLCYDTFYSAGLGLLAGEVVGGFIFSAVGGYAIDGVEGARNGVAGFVNMFRSASSGKVLSAHQGLSIFNDINRDFKNNLAQRKTEKHRELSRSILRKQ
jgi:hypothetical protein